MCCVHSPSLNRASLRRVHRRRKVLLRFTRSNSTHGAANCTCAGRVRVFSKRGNDLSFRFPDLVGAVAALPIDNVILDGEVTALDEEGLPDFEALQRADRNYLQSFWSFDPLRSCEKDLRLLALEERKARLKEIVAEAENPHLRFSESFDDAEALLSVGARMRLEGIVSKKRDSAYRSGPSQSWLKIKTASWRDANRERSKLFEKRA